MTTNPILDEIHAIREKLLADHKGDVHAYIQAARKRALESGRRIVQPKQRTKDIGIGARIAPGPLPHHLACGSAPGGSISRSESFSRFHRDSPSHSRLDSRLSKPVLRSDTST